jgi:hypothetical protein
VREEYRMQSLSDMDKVKELFDELWIDYDEEQTVKNNNAVLRISDKNINPDENAFSQSLDIVFDENGKFKFFDPYGE